MNADYKQMIIDIVNKMNDAELLSRIYNLAKYLYIYKDNDSRKIANISKEG